MALLANQIWQCLDLDLLDGAEFLAEQLVANEDDADARYLLGTVQYRKGQYESVKLTTAEHLSSYCCAFLYAQSCYKLRQGAEGARVLSDTRAQWALSNDMPLQNRLGRGELSPAAFHLLLARLLGLSDRDAALREFTQSTKLNPYLFENVAALCASTDVIVKPDTLFACFEDPFGEAMAEPEEAPVVPQTITSTPRRIETPRRALATPMVPRSSLRVHSGVSAGGNVPLNAPWATASGNGGGGGGSTGGGSTGGGSGSGSAAQTGSGSGGLGGGAFAGFGASAQPGASGPSGGGRSASTLQTPTHTPAAAPAPHAAHGGGRRRADRMLSLSFKRSDQSSFNTLGRNLLWAADQTSTAAAVEKTGVAALEGVIHALELLSQASFRAALDQVLELAAPVRRTPFVTALMGRLHLELADYKSSAAAYGALRRAQPDRARDMEYYSTVLWHLKREKDLALLAYDFTHDGSPHRQQWQSWCVLGNAMSLRHDTQGALQCFARATQLNPRSAYAFTLMGYEYAANEELEGAITAFGNALRHDAEQYNAWYGLGSVNHSMGNYKEAETYFAQAIRLNPNNSVLLCFMGTVLEAQGKYTQALAQFTRASEILPESPMPRFRKAEALLAAGSYDEAVRELLVVEKVAPEEASVQFALGKAYKGLGEGENALKRFTYAQQLSPRSAAAVRNELDEMN